MTITFDTEADLDLLIDLVVKKTTISPRWLKLGSATKYAAIHKDKLKRLAEDGYVIGYRDPTTTRGDWIFDKNSLDDYRLGQSKEIEINETVSDLKRYL